MTKAMNPPCPLCDGRGTMVEGPLSDGGFFCSGCGRVFLLDANGELVKHQRTNHTAESAFRQAVKRATEKAGARRE